MLFDPTKSRTKGFSPGMIDFFLEAQYDPARPMGNFGAHDVAVVIHAWLVGLHAEIAPILPRALLWIQKAIAEDEEFGVDQNGHRTTLHWANALGTWMNTGLDNDGEWNKTRVYEEARWRFEKRPWPTSEIVKYGLDDYMAFSFQGGEHDDGFEAGIDMYERWTGKTNTTLSGTLKPREFGYALCLCKAGRRDFDKEDLFKAGRKMLRANLQENWLGGGQFIRAATWLKIVYWHRDEALTPLQTVLKAYENLPKVPRPDFVPAG